MQPDFPLKLFADENRAAVPRQRVPLPLSWLKGERMANVACNRETAIAFSEDGAIHLWGRKHKVVSSKDKQQVGRTDALDCECSVPSCKSALSTCSRST